MDNPHILKLLEKQRDSLFDKLKSSTISGLYKEEYDEIKAGRVFVFDNGEKQMLRDLKKLLKDTSFDSTFKNKLQEYKDLENELLVDYFFKEFQRVINQIKSSEKLNEIQAIFTECDHYYSFTSCLTCYGMQDYPIIEEPRYISNEYDFNKQVLYIDNGINFKPSWVNCEEFANLDYLDIDFELERLFQLHSRTLLHKAIDKINSGNQLEFLINRPFTFYINEHDSEVMTLYRLA